MAVQADSRPINRLPFRRPAASPSLVERLLNSGIDDDQREPRVVDLAAEVDAKRSPLEAQARSRTTNQTESDLLTTHDLYAVLFRVYAQGLRPWLLLILSSR